MLADRLVLPGMVGLTRFGYGSARRHWKPVSAYLRDRHIVITGTTSGLGLATAEALAARLLKKGKAVDALVNNAGALVNPREETAEGLERSFALLLLSPYLLTERLHPLLKKAASRHAWDASAAAQTTSRAAVR